eukprot:scaffold28368_cov63-Phaeocystis_antarctica.AAC.6
MLESLGPLSRGIGREQVGYGTDAAARQDDRIYAVRWPNAQDLCSLKHGAHGLMKAQIPAVAAGQERASERSREHINIERVRDWRRVTEVARGADLENSPVLSTARQKPELAAILAHLSPHEMHHATPGRELQLAVAHVRFAYRVAARRSDSPRAGGSSTTCRLSRARCALLLLIGTREVTPVPVGSTVCRVEAVFAVHSNSANEPAGVVKRGMATVARHGQRLA